MKHIFLALSLACCSLSAMAQTASNPVLMRIQGKPVTRGEFEYAYNKNNSVEGAVEQKTVREYLDMFINYKLKVAAAEALKMDTISSFRTEFQTYRDMQLTPGLVDQVFIDSVAHSLYDRQIKLVNGKDLLTASHILLMVNQTATDQEKQVVAQRADSVYQALTQGADFATLAKAVSQDPGSASKGGKLPTLYPGMTIKEFEDQAYQLQAGQFSRPFQTPIGYHIVMMHERKALESFETLYPTIIEALKRQGIEDASAEQKLNKLVAAGRTREEVMDSLLQARTATNPNLKYLVQEYYDGLLLYEVSKKYVWDVAAQDSKGLEQMFKKNRKKYRWEKPHFKGYIASAKNPKAAKSAQKLLLKHQPNNNELRDFFKETLNKDSVVVVANGQHLLQQGENTTIDNLAFKQKSAEVKPVRPNFPYTVIAGKVYKQPTSYQDVKPLVVADLQQAMEAAWVAELRKVYQITVDENVLKTVNNHQ